MPVIRIPSEDINTETIRTLELSPHSFVYNDTLKQYQYDIKAHNFINLSWKRLLNKTALKPLEPKLFTDENQNCDFIIEYSKEMQDQYFMIEQKLLDCNLCILKNEQVGPKKYLVIKQLLRNSHRARKPMTYIRHLILELLWFCETITTNFVIEPYIQIHVKQSCADTLEYERDEVTNKTIIKAPFCVLANIKSRFKGLVKDGLVFYVPTYLTSYESEYNILINYLELYHTPDYPLKDSTGSIKVASEQDHTMIEHLNFRYHNLCKIGSLKTDKAIKLINPSGEKFKYYYPDVLEPLLYSIERVTREIPRGYHIQNNKVYVWMKKLKKNDPTFIYLKNMFLNLYEGAQILDQVETKKKIEIALPTDQYSVNALLDKKTNEVCCYFLENKDYALVLDLKGKY